MQTLKSNKTFIGQEKKNEQEESLNKAKKINRISPKYVISLAIFLFIVLSIFFFIKWNTLAIVEGKRITRIEVLKRIEKNYKSQTLSDIVNAQILENALNKSNVKLDENEFKKQADQKIKQSKGTNLSENEIRKQVETQLKIEALLGNKVIVTEDEITINYNEFKNSKYKDKLIQYVRQEILNELKEKKLNEEFSKWFNDIKSKAEVKIFN